MHIEIIYMRKDCFVKSVNLNELILREKIIKIDFQWNQRIALLNHLPL